MSSKKRKADQLSTLVLENIQCQLCFDVVPAPIMSCSNSHILFAVCLGNLPAKKCPSCQVGIENMQRNRIAETFASDVEVECPLDNCEAKMKHSKLAEHL